jgi:hypothetical protein
MTIRPAPQRRDVTRAGYPGPVIMGPVATQDRMQGCRDGRGVRMRAPQHRDEGWFTTVYAAQYPHVVRYGRRRLADPDAAVKLAQEVFAVAWRRRAEVPDRSLPWPAVALADLRAALATLSEVDQEILRLIGWEELTVAARRPTRRLVPVAGAVAVAAGAAVAVRAAGMSTVDRPKGTSRPGQVIVPIAYQYGTASSRSGRPPTPAGWSGSPRSKTGGLLADELLTRVPKQVTTYELFLATDRTDRIG